MADIPLRLTLTLYGKNLDPDVLTFVLNRSPRVAYRAGEQLPSGAIAGHGKWCLALEFASVAEVAQAASQMTASVCSLRSQELAWMFVEQLSLALNVPNEATQRAQALSREARERLEELGVQVTFSEFDAYDVSDPHWMVS